MITRTVYIVCTVHQTIKVIKNFKLCFFPVKLKEIKMQETKLEVYNPHKTLHSNCAWLVPSCMSPTDPHKA